MVRKLKMSGVKLIRKFNEGSLIKFNEEEQLKNGDNYYNYTICNKKYKIIVEIDSPICFNRGKNKASIQINIIKRMKVAFDNGYSVIRIYKTDIDENRIDWYEKTQNIIDKIINQTQSGFFWVESMNDKVNETYEDMQKLLNIPTVKV
jgi:very-short-patch-repair endonuclease